MVTVIAKVVVVDMSFVNLREELDFGSHDGKYYVQMEKDFNYAGRGQQISSIH